ncbi:MAG: hypothetical protein ACPGU4_10390, partial [Flavobacteriales bacterium]
EITSVSIDKAIPLGLITVELLINSFKYAFENQDNGEIKIVTRKCNEANYSSCFEYKDNGKGFDQLPKSNGLGMEIIKGLTGQLHGQITMDGNNGFNATILF